ncbi:MAG: hypothetical protein WCQ54_09135 [Clostridiaceae bacterium]
MEYSNWLNETNKKLDDYISCLDKKTVKKFRLQLLKRIAERTEEFSSKGCNECEENKENINKLLLMLDEHNNNFAVAFKNYNAIIRKLIEHLQKKHGLTEEGANVAIWMPIGMSLGMCLGMSFGSNGLSIGLSLGLAVGVAVGSGLDSKAKKEGKNI